MKLQALRNLDAFPRAEEHLLKKTQSGGVVSMIGLAVMALLFIHELKYYLTIEKVHQMSVDVKRGETLPININMTFPSLPCDVLSVDAIDLSGKHEVDLDTNIWKLRLNKDGQIIGTEYLSDLVEKEHETHKHDDSGEHKNSSHHMHDHAFFKDSDKMVKDVKRALENGEGCRVYGVLDVQRVAGNFHISVHGLSLFVAQQSREVPALTCWRRRPTLFIVRRSHCSSPPSDAKTSAVCRRPPSRRPFGCRRPPFRRSSSCARRAPPSAALCSCAAKGLCVALCSRRRFLLPLPPSASRSALLPTPPSSTLQLLPALVALVVVWVCHYGSLFFLVDGQSN
ncbi:hypothetical protein EJ110_NYTH34116 [Nymphaea thermarum]|nr:hypothetical protein EJ110_NYTH34116 [Nymphaea thermarum]